jgi:hypothetical protein
MQNCSWLFLITQVSMSSFRTFSKVFRSFSTIFGVVQDDPNNKGLGQEQCRRLTRDAELSLVVPDNLSFHVKLPDIVQSVPAIFRVVDDHQNIERLGQE